MTTLPTHRTRRFPPQPVREVSITHVRQTSCGGPFAIVTMDFEPLPDDELSPVVLDWPVRDRPEVREQRRAWPEDKEWVGLLERALEQGVRNALDALGPDIRPAVRCIVTDFRWHPVDSGERGFVQAGEMAVREARRRCER
ncbi:hypothetical protein ACIRPT_24775 [Streptomyces sp. NPDC101227]|uniref:hypothetical protein n=1 Tax=Streptomyces sp. NPDC101227 TaxID=3366136 RepID=UPI003806CB1F